MGRGGGSVIRSGEERTRPSAVQLAKRHESWTLVVNMFHRKRVQKKLRVGPGKPSKHKTVQIKFYGAKAIPGKYYSLYGVNRQQHRDMCASVCVQVHIVQSQALEHFAKTRIHKYQPFIMLICSKVPDVNYVFPKRSHVAYKHCHCFFTYVLPVLF